MLGMLEATIGRVEPPLLDFMEATKGNEEDQFSWEDNGSRAKENASTSFSIHTCQVFLQLQHEACASGHTHWCTHHTNLCSGQWLPANPGHKAQLNLVWHVRKVEIVLVKTWPTTPQCSQPDAFFSWMGSSGFPQFSLAFVPIFSSS